MVNVIAENDYFFKNKHKVDFTGQGRVDWLAGIR